jgi:hypothetical protein
MTRSGIGQRRPFRAMPIRASCSRNGREMLLHPRRAEKVVQRLVVARSVRCEQVHELEEDLRDRPVERPARVVHRQPVGFPQSPEFDHLTDGRTGLRGLLERGSVVHPAPEPRVDVLPVEARDEAV